MPPYLLQRGPETGLGLQHVREQGRKRGPGGGRRRRGTAATDGLQQSVHVITFERVPTGRHVVSENHKTETVIPIIY